MTKRLASLHGFVGLRTNERRWVYLVCEALVLLMALWSTEEGVSYAVPYIPILILFIVQFFRPTLLGWGLAFVLFSAYTTAILFKASFTAEYGAGLLIGLVPSLALFWARPRHLVNWIKDSSE